MSTKPFIIQQQPTYNFFKADWQQFQEILDNKIKLNKLNNSTTQELEEEILNWMKIVKEAMNKTTPLKTYKRNYSLVITQETEALER